MTRVFSEDYSDIYDLLYKDKDYNLEAQYVFRLLRNRALECRSLLEFGSGTGRHARILASQGVEIVGVDQSKSMLDRARRNPVDGITYVQGDIRDISIGRKFDAVISVFHVISYLGSNDDILKTFQNARLHLERGGLFLFDFWYGPAVLSIRPESRINEVSDEHAEIFRIARTTLRVNDNAADVLYSFLAHKRSEPVLLRKTEVHSMRYYFYPELDFFLDRSGFRIVSAHEWLTDRPLSTVTWNGCILAEAV